MWYWRRLLHVLCSMCVRSRDLSVHAPVLLPLHLSQSRHRSLKRKYLLFTCEDASFIVLAFLQQTK